jgi:hypothetical protein
MGIIIALIASIICGIYILGDAPKRNMSGAWSILGFVFGILGVIIYLVARKPITNITNMPTNNINMPTSSHQMNIPDTCPHCKNPNSKRIRMCEWCGGQIV